VAREFGRTFESVLSQDQYCRAPPGVAAISRSDLTGGDRSRDPRFLFVTGQIREHEATQQYARIFATLSRVALATLDSRLPSNFTVCGQVFPTNDRSDSAICLINYPRQ
jgi:hypothetical protein